jgi:VWFA-related protein
MKAIARGRKMQFLVLILAGFALAAANPALAQSPSGPIAPTPGQAPQKAPQQPSQKPLDQSIRVRVNLVNAPVVVRDTKGELVLDLLENNFRIYDNGVKQKIEGFDVGGAPLSVVIVMEKSSRIQALLPAVHRTGVLFTETVIGENGDAAVIGYDDEVTRLQDFTTDHDAIEKTIANLNPGNSGTRLYDALSSAVSMLENRPAARRRVVITVAEAVDSGSEAKLGQVLRAAQLANITIYSVGLSTTEAESRGEQKSGAPPSATPPGIFGTPGIPGTPQTPTTEALRNGNMDLMSVATWIVQHVDTAVKERPLEVATVATGGLYQSTVKDASIEKAIDEIGGELHAEYTISYRPTDTNTAGYHAIRVQVADRRTLTVRSRPGYFLGNPGA